MDLLNYRIETFGCKVNTYDTGLLQQRLSREGFVVKEQNAHVHILNTCAVTHEATKEAARRVRKIKVQDPMALVVVTGCGAQVDTDFLSQVPGVDLVVANSHKGRLSEIIRDYYSGRSQQKVYKSNIFKKDDLEAGGGLEEGHTRAFLKIQDGCNSFCTFCVIPFARGKSRSIAVSDLIRRVDELVGQGFKEVVLTGVHIGDYEEGLENLVEQILLKTKIARLRLTSLEPIELSQRLLDLYQDERMCRHFHMSIQSANTSVLKAMKRKYTAQEVERSLLSIAEQLPGSFVGMDVIAGFPTETENDFKDTYQRLSQLPWTRIHVFPYSVRPGTFAARFEEFVPAAEIQRRATQLRELSSTRYAEHALNQIGQFKKVLLLKSAAQVNVGLSRDFWNVQLETTDLKKGEEYQVNITGYDHSNHSRMAGSLIGQIG